MPKIEIPEFGTNKEMFQFLSDNQGALIAQKKAELKRADSLLCPPVMIVGSGKQAAEKSNEIIESPPDVLNARLAINTTNLMDGHDDVHIPGLWDKSLQENKFLMLLNAHSMTFKDIISDGEDLSALAKMMTWKSLGFKWEGETEVLLFNAKIRKSRNEFMHDQYAKAYVKNHSVGMQYVRLALAINDEDFGSEFEVWEKYIDQIVNRDYAEDKGFFWAVKEAKAIEGSAVPRGSNYATPTIDNNSKFAPSDDTQTEETAAPSKDTRKSFNELLQTSKIL